MKPTVLALDLGLSYTGYAFRGPSTLIEDTGQMLTKDNLYARLDKLLAKYSPEVLVLGQPLHGPITQLAQKVAAHYAKNHKIFIVNEDKTTKQAEFRLLQLRKPKSRQDKIHSHSAANILEEYELIYES